MNTTSSHPEPQRLRARNRSGRERVAPGEPGVPHSEEPLERIGVRAAADAVPLPRVLAAACGRNPTYVTGRWVDD